VIHNNPMKRLMGCLLFAMMMMGGWAENTIPATTHTPNPSSREDYPKITDVSVVSINNNAEIKISDVEKILQSKKGEKYDVEKIRYDEVTLRNTGQYRYVKIFTSHIGVEDGVRVIHFAVALQEKQKESKETFEQEVVLATFANSRIKINQIKREGSGIKNKRHEVLDMDNSITLEDVLSETVWKEVALEKNREHGQLTGEKLNENISRLRKEALINIANKKILKKIYQSSSFRNPDYEIHMKEKEEIKNRYEGQRTVLHDAIEAQGIRIADWKGMMRTDFIEKEVSRFLLAKGISITPDDLEQDLCYADIISEYIWGCSSQNKKDFCGVPLEIPEYVSEDFSVYNTKNGESAFIEKVVKGAFIIDEIELYGHSLPDSVIRSEVYCAPGELIDPDLLRKSCECILELGFFSAITVNYEETERPDRKKLHFEVEERHPERDRNATTINVPDGTKEIEPAKFCLFTSAMEVNLPTSLNKIGNQAFAYCRLLTNVVIPNGVKSLGSYAFFNCNKLTDIKLPDNLESIGVCAFASSGITNAVITQNMTNPLSIYDSCSNIVSCTVSERNNLFSSIDGVLFSKDKTKLICFPPKYSQTTYIIPNTCTSIGDYAFISAPRLTNLIIKTTVTNIGKYAFVGVTSKSSIRLPKSLSRSDMSYIGITKRDVVQGFSE
jgi:hypothetical protein